MPVKRSLSIPVLALIVVPFTCCVIPYGCLYAGTPVTYEYEPDQGTHTIDGLEFTIFLRGDNDYALDESGPRTVYLLLKRGSKPLPDAFRVLDIQTTSSTCTPIAAHTPGTLPADVPFTQSGSLRYASWKGDQNFNPDLAAGEIITVTARVEITRGATTTTTTTHTVTVTFTPERIHRPIGGILPSI